MYCFFATYTNLALLHFSLRNPENLDDVWQRSTAFAYREHTRQIVVYTAGEYRSEYYPEECRRSEEYTHYRAEYRTQSGDVEKLNQEYPPRFHRYIVHAVGLCQRGGLRFFIDTKHALHESAVEQESDHKAVLRCQTSSAMN